MKNPEPTPKLHWNRTGILFLASVFLPNLTHLILILLCRFVPTFAARIYDEHSEGFWMLGKVRDALDACTFYLELVHVRSPLSLDINQALLIPAAVLSLKKLDEDVLVEWARFLIALVWAVLALAVLAGSPNRSSRNFFIVAASINAAVAVVACFRYNTTYWRYVAALTHGLGYGMVAFGLLPRRFGYYSLLPREFADDEDHFDNDIEEEEGSENDEGNAEEEEEEPPNIQFECPPLETNSEVQHQAQPDNDAFESEHIEPNTPFDKEKSE